MALLPRTSGQGDKERKKLANKRHDDNKLRAQPTKRKRDTDGALSSLLVRGRKEGGREIGTWRQKRRRG